MGDGGSDGDVGSNGDAVYSKLQSEKVGAASLQIPSGEVG